MKKLILLLLMAVMSIPAIVSANSNGYIPLFMLNPVPENIQSVYHVTNISSGDRQVTFTFYDNAGNKLSGAPIYLAVAGKYVFNNSTGTTAENTVNTAQDPIVYTNSDGTVNAKLLSFQQMYVILRGTSNPTGFDHYVYNGWGVISSSPDGNSLIANGFIRNGGPNLNTSTQPYQRAVTINGGSPF